MSLQCLIEYYFCICSLLVYIDLIIAPAFWTRINHVQVSALTLVERNINYTALSLVLLIHFLISGLLYMKSNADSGTQKFLVA